MSASNASCFLPSESDLFFIYSEDLRRRIITLVRCVFECLEGNRSNHGLSTRHRAYTWRNYAFCNITFVMASVAEWTPHRTTRHDLSVDEDAYSYVVFRLVDCPAESPSDSPSDMSRGQSVGQLTRLNKTRTVWRQFEIFDMPTNLGAPNTTKLSFTQSACNCKWIVFNVSSTLLLVLSPKLLNFITLIIF